LRNNVQSFVLQVREKQCIREDQQIVVDHFFEVQTRSTIEVRCIGRSSVQGDSFMPLSMTVGHLRNLRNLRFLSFAAYRRSPLFPAPFRAMTARNAAVDTGIVCDRIWLARFVNVAAALLLASCGEAPRGRPEASDTAVVSAAVSPAESAQSGIRFDPITLRPGERVGDLVADTVAFRPTLVDSTLVGMARFSGEMQLTGRTIRHPDADLRHTEMCFEADSSSATRLPRWPADERRPWFCFVNRDAAVRALGGPSEGIAATIVIDQFTIHRGLTDEVNSARLVRIVQEASNR
jgi:hypothetical protein